GRFVALGTKDSAHVLIDRKTGQRRMFDAVSSYPCATAFHADRPEVVFSSCHALYGSGTLAVALDGVIAGVKQPARVIDRRSWVYAVGSLPSGFVLGDSRGYPWAVDSDGTLQRYA